MKIYPYSPTLRTFFKTLNEEWLNECFVVEPCDAKLIENCEREIITISINDYTFPSNMNLKLPLDL